jgi:hypothetical protein
MSVKPRTFAEVVGESRKEYRIPFSKGHAEDAFSNQLNLLLLFDGCGDPMR